MIDVKRAMTGTTLTLNNSQEKSGPEKPYDLVEQFLKKDLDYTPQDDADEGHLKDESEVEEDLERLDTGPLELESGPLELDEMPDMHEELTHLPDSSEIDESILELPAMTTEAEPPARRAAMRRRRSEDHDDNMVNAADAGESDAVMTYLREIGRVPMITHEREIELAQRIEGGDRDAISSLFSQICVSSSALPSAMLDVA